MVCVHHKRRATTSGSLATPPFQSDQNLMPVLIHCVKEFATLGEICDTLKEIFGTYQEPSF